MKKSISLCIVAGLLAAVAGCGDHGTPAAGHGGLGIVNPDKVAQQLGWLDKFNQGLASDQQALNGKLQELKAVLDKQVNDMKKKLSEKVPVEKRDDFMSSNNATDMVEKFGVSKDQVEDLVRLVVNSNQNLQSAAASVRQIMTERQQKLAQAYRTIIEPVARRVARDSGVSAVIIPNPTLLYYDTAVDLTDKVIDDMQKTPPAVPVLEPLQLPSITGPAPSTQPAR